MLWKVELFFLYQTRMKEMFHAVWDAGCSFTAKIRMETDSVKKLVPIHARSENKLASSALFLHCSNVK